MLMKLTPVVDFTNFLHVVFTCADPKSAKDTDDLTFYFALLGPARVEAWHKHVGEIDPWMS